jgi:hypothetical protein
MNFDDFVAKMTANKYSPEYVENIDGTLFMFMAWNKSIYDVTDYKNNDSQITHACLERHINKKVEVINFVRDTREDWGDDGGYCFYTGKYKGKYVLGSNFISYNSDFSKDFININELEARDENEEYILFDTILEVEYFIGRMIAKTQELLAEDDAWGYESWDLEENDFESPFMHKCIRNLGSAFCEYSEKDTANLLALTKPDIYIPNYLDPQEFYGSWIEHDTYLEPIITL